MDTISFTKVDLPYGWLGNMSPHIVKYDGQWYKTTESLFQCMRFKDYPEVQEEIRNQKSPMSAKMVAKKHKHLISGKTTKIVEETNDLIRMRECLLLKLKHHPDLIRRLLGTGESVLIEDCSKRRGGTGLIWGMAKEPDGTWVGRNELGKLWMSIREELRDSKTINQEQAGDVSSPVKPIITYIKEANYHGNI